MVVPLDPAPLPLNIPQSNPLLTHTSEDLARLNEIHSDFPSDQNDDEASDNGMETLQKCTMDEIQ